MEAPKYPADNREVLREDARLHAAQVYETAAGKHLEASDRCGRIGQKLVELHSQSPNGDRSLSLRFAIAFTTYRLTFEFARARRAGRRMVDADLYQNAVLGATDLQPESQ